MKKLLGIIVLGLLLSGNAYADEPKIVKFYCVGGTNGDLNNFEINEINKQVIWSFKYPQWSKFKTENLKIKSTDGKKVFIKGFKGKPWDYETAEKFERNFGANNFKCEKISDTPIAKTQDITFTIKDKKKQCEAIGFVTATEKFADCVLELVVLDVKSQQANQIALAQSQGNQQVVTQLQNQRNDQSSQAFIDLGLKLLSPQSTVSAPTTSTCRVIGSGAFKTVNCW